MIGTKGRDMAVWAFYMLAGVGILTPWTVYILFPAGLALAIILYFYLVERRRGIRYRQVVLLPVCPLIARAVLRRSLRGNWIRAYEIHIMFNTELPLRQQRNNIVSDLQDIIETRPGLYFWETHVTVPMPVRNVVKELERQGAGFFREGALLPRPPFVYTRRRYNKPLHHGAAIILRGGSDA